MQTFLAIDIPAQVKETITHSLHDIRDTYPMIRWVQDINYHITMYFFGEIPEHVFDAFADRLHEQLYDINPFNVTIFKGDVKARNTMLLFMNTYRIKTLETIVKRIQKDMGEKVSRSFMPHVTVARSKIFSKQQYFLIKKKMQNVIVDITFPVNSLTLYKSVNQDSHPLYIPLKTYTLENV